MCIRDSFDTGCPQSFFSMEFIRSLGIVDGWKRRYANSKETKSGSKFQYKTAAVEAIIPTQLASPDVTLNVHAVRRWNASPFARRCPIGNCSNSAKDGENEIYWCGKRYGLVGRSLLVENTDLRIILDAGERRTFAQRSSDGGE